MIPSSDEHTDRMTCSTTVTDAFESAKDDFLLNFPKGSNYDFSNFSTIDDVYNATDQIQKDQAKSGTLRNLGKIQPFLECLSSYAKVIDTFVQVKPDILALIWGPVRLVLLISSTYMKAFDKLLDVISQIGAALPAFQKYAGLFKGNTQIHQVLCVFFRDILDFHAIVLGFFKHKKWSILFESLWPRYAGKLKVVQDNITKHRMLMQGEVTIAEIAEAHSARTRSLEEYERSHEFQQRQDFDMVFASLAPNLYDEELERLKEKCVIDSASWLSSNPQFQQWFDASDDSIRLLWLEGIPGAGKTYLSSIIIRQIASRKDPLAFAFLNYRQKTSPLGVLHSLAFQIVLDNKDLQPKLVSAYDKSFRKLTSSVEFAKDLLKDLLVGSSTTYIVLDGLDEMRDSERVILVQALLDLQDQRKSLKLLIASRAEHDISRLLSGKVEPIRVHEANHYDIQTYVDRRALTLISDLGLDLEVGNEMSQLMKPVATNARGMFLYARLLCDTLVLMGDLDSVREEVNNLPNGLDEAYGRILSRIDDNLSEREREEAREILGLVACSAVPLSKTEIQLAVSTSRGGNPSRGCRRLFLDLIQRCGPILEEIDGSIQFVHFSIHEFLFSTQSAPGGYLQDADVNASLVSMCLRYLSSECFDADLSDDVLQSNIMSGAYVFEGYACLYWLRHVKKAGAARNRDLLADLRQLMTARRNTGFSGDAASSSKEFDRFKDAQPDIFDVLIQADTFARRRWREFCLSDNDLSDWEYLDPLTLSGAQLRIRRSLESALCETKSHRHSCQCSSLKSLYGEHIYKCGRYGCPFYRIGFKTQAQRNQHMKVHTRPYKCDQEDCPFFELGFRTQALLNVHLKHYHTDNLARSKTMPRKLGSDAEMASFLEDAVKADDFETILDLSEEARKCCVELLLTAIKEGSSSAILHFLMGQVKSEDSFRLGSRSRSLGNDIFRTAAEMVNLEVFRFFPLKTDPYSLYLFSRSFAKALTMERSAELIKLVFPLCRVRAEWFFNGLHPSRPDIHEEALVLECLHRLPNLFNERELELGLRTLASGCCSIPIATFYLAQGANVDGRNNLTAYTPLFIASGKDSMEALQFMRFLLENGADPEAQPPNRPKLSTRIGPKNCLRRLGISWNALVAQASRRRDNPNRSDTTSNTGQRPNGQPL
ncbi:hypothetical protein B0T10DRAFT_515086 [Thelonectria olida]|uniref:NACHT domain-containing protein n=1 Tax=Thelonectria olida TaxID=1576542 RepID=A0A9P8W3M7_9HYPO|nr:hypothetical protein B0T10DRAFT_515086 [Thelonectria olida]